MHLSHGRARNLLKPLGNPRLDPVKHPHRLLLEAHFALIVEATPIEQRLYLWSDHTAQHDGLSIILCPKPTSVRPTRTCWTSPSFKEVRTNTREVCIAWALWDLVHVLEDVLNMRPVLHEEDVC